MMTDKITGTVCHVLPNGSAFISPDGCTFNDRATSIYCHARALARSGISNVMHGTRMAFNTKPPRFEGGKVEACDIELLDV
jgi:cold shock CspA family protein